MRKTTLICFIALSTAIGRAESVLQNIHSMFTAVPKQLVITNDNHTGTTDFVTYTCNSGADFFYDGSKSGGKYAIFLEASGEQVVTSQINNLDSLRISHCPTGSHAEFKIEISKDSISWTEVSPSRAINGHKEVKMPYPDNYYVRLTRKGSYNVYITEIAYTYIDLSGCNCFLYRPE